MLPLALIVQSLGAKVSGSDRSRDQGRTPDKFAWLQKRGFDLYPQDGSGVNDTVSEVIVSTAVENSVPDVAAAIERDIPVLHRAALLARLFNAANTRVAIAGTSGKSTVTGMVAFILHEMELRPTVMNGAVMRNFASFNNPYASALVGGAEIFVTEADESDGSIAFYEPDIAVVTNIALDHKNVDELVELFDAFCAKARTIVINGDDPACAPLIAKHKSKAIVYSIKDPFTVELQVPGRHNRSNAAAALAVIEAMGLDVEAAKRIITGFTGIKRRLETVGTADGVTVIDDFAHNPDKVLGSLGALKETPGRLLVLYQPHGYGMLKLTGAAMGKAFATMMDEEDRLFITQPLYLGGTVDKSVGADIIAQEVPRSRIYQSKEKAMPDLLAEAKAGDRIVIMGARDDTLSLYAAELLEVLGDRKHASP